MTSFSVYNDKYSLDDVTSDLYVVVVSWVGHETNVPRAHAQGDQRDFCSCGLNMNADEKCAQDIYLISLQLI